MRCRSLIMLAVLAGMFLMTPLSCSSASGEEDLEQAQLEYLCALVSMSAYDGDLNLVVRRSLQEMGWQYDPFVESGRKANAHFFMIHRMLPNTKKKVSILAIRGTSDRMDARVDFRTQRVLFGGRSPEEFLRIAQGWSEDESLPRVHKGFDDYTNTALFQAPIAETDGLTLGELLAKELREHPEEKLIITGHSLGGSVAILSAARLSDMGVEPRQLEVVTFGAPAVGNAGFVKKYGERFHLTRVIMPGDPINGIMEAVKTGYEQFPQHVERRKSPVIHNFPHEMVNYLESEMRNFYDVRKSVKGIEALSTGYFEIHPNIDAKVYAALSFDMDERIRSNVPYMETAMGDLLSAGILHPIVEMTGEKAVAELCRRGEELGCQYVLVERFSGKHLRDDRYDYRIVMEESLYDRKGNLLETQITSTITKKMPPLPAAMYVQMAGRERREEALLSHGAQSYSASALPK